MGTGEVARLRSYITQRPPFDVKNPYMAPIKVNKNIHNEGSGRHCLHIEVDIEGSRIRYDAGDHIAVYPTNNLELVDKLASILDINMEQVFTMTNVDEDSTKKHPFPCPTTYRTALSHYVEITALPRTHILKELAQYTSDPAEKAKIDQLQACLILKQSNYWWKDCIPAAGDGIDGLMTFRECALNTTVSWVASRRPQALDMLDLFMKGNGNTVEDGGLVTELV